jgi:hypothetical protein
MSGLSRTPGKRVWDNTHRGFESRSLRQDTRRKLSEPKTNTPLNALFCGVFRVNLLTSPTPQMSFLA